MSIDLLVTMTRCSETCSKERKLERPFCVDHDWKSCMHDNSYRMVNKGDTYYRNTIYNSEDLKKYPKYSAPSNGYLLHVYVGYGKHEQMFSLTTCEHCK